MSLVRREQVNVSQRGSGFVVGAARSGDKLLGESELCGFFDGVNTLLDFVRSEMPVAKKGKSSSQEREGGFNSFRSYEEAFEVYRNNPSKVRDFEEADVQLTDDESAGMSVQYDITGDFLDVGRFVEGEPECFGNMSSCNPRGRRVNLILNLNWVWSTNSDVLNARSRRVQRLVDWLESQSVRTSITAMSSSGCEHLEIEVKSHDEALDLNDLAVVSHGDFFRRIIFRFMEYSDTWRGGYGSAAQLNDVLRSRPLTPEYANELTVVVSNSVDDVDSLNRRFDEAEKHLASVLSAPAIGVSDSVFKMFT